MMRTLFLQPTVHLKVGQAGFSEDDVVAVFELMGFEDPGSSTVTAKDVGVVGTCEIPEEVLTVFYAYFCMPLADSFVAEDYVLIGSPSYSSLLAEEMHSPRTDSVTLHEVEERASDALSAPANDHGAVAGVRRALAAAVDDRAVIHPVRRTRPVKAPVHHRSVLIRFRIEPKSSAGSRPVHRLIEVAAATEAGSFLRNGSGTLHDCRIPPVTARGWRGRRLTNPKSTSRADSPIEPGIVSASTTRSGHRPAPFLSWT